MFRMYRLFAMETILATAFGREVNIQRGESDGLTKTAYTISNLMTEGQLTSREILHLIFSESSYIAALCLYNIIIFTAGNLPWAVPLARIILMYSSKGDIWRYMNKTALELVEARRRSANSGRKVC